jgi:hypothetical protein
MRLAREFSHVPIVDVSGLVFRQQNITGFYVDQSNHVTGTSLTVSGAGSHGVTVDGSSSVALSKVDSSDNAAIGVRFANLGTGYWLLPTGSPDPTSDGALDWRFRAAFAGGWPAGRHELLFAAIDENGRSGNQVGLTVCLLPEVPDNGNVCSPSKAPPAARASMSEGLSPPTRRTPEYGCASFELDADRLALDVAPTVMPPPSVRDGHQERRPSSSVIVCRSTNTGPTRN